MNSLMFKLVLEKAEEPEIKLPTSTGMDLEQQTGSKSGKEYVKAVYCHPTYLTYMQSK